MIPSALSLCLLSRSWYKFININFQFNSLLALFAYICYYYVSTNFSSPIYSSFIFIIFFFNPKKYLARNSVNIRNNIKINIKNAIHGLKERKCRSCTMSTNDDAKREIEIYGWQSNASFNSTDRR